MMDKVIYHDINIFNPEYIMNAYENILCLNFDLTSDDVRPIINWCDKNLSDIVFVNFFDINLLAKETYFNGIEAYLYKIDRLDTYYPIFKFMEISDMMAFKLRWLDFISISGTVRVKRDNPWWRIKIKMVGYE